MAKRKVLRAPEWRLKQLYKDLGGADALIVKIEDAGYAPPPLSTIKGWSYRESIPPKWLLVVLMIAFRESVITDVSDLAATENA